MWLPTAEEAAAFDRRAIDQLNVPGPVLMENAGRSAAHLLSHFVPHGTVAVVAGRGNNGGDAVVLARTLRAQGRAVHLFVAPDRPAPDPLLHGWSVPTEVLAPGSAHLTAQLARADVLVDGLLGTGIRGAPRAPAARFIQAINDAGRPVLSLDVPSGVDGTTGEVPGAAVRADLTVAFGAPKLGTILLPGREHAGRLFAVEIGFPPMTDEAAGARLITSAWVAANRPRRPLGTHKKAEGRILLFAGSSGMAGAAILSARGALRAGAGYVRVASDPSNRSILQRTVPEAIFVDASDRDALRSAVQDSDAVAAGPGIGLDDAARQRLGDVVRAVEERGLLLDADALTLLGAEQVPDFPAEPPMGECLLTPHPGEMVRLGFEREAVRSRPLHTCREGAERWSAALLLKGMPSMVCGPRGGPIWVSSSGSSSLARAGMGDVLTGVAGAFLARGTSAVEAGALALHLTGRAAALAGGSDALLPSDVVDAMGPAFVEAEHPARGRSPELPFVTLDLGRPD